MKQLRPYITTTNEKNWRDKLDQLHEAHPEIKIINHYQSQLEELFVIRNPEKADSKSHQEKFIRSILKDISPDDHGNWIYYDWNNTLVHVLPEIEYQEVRTARNRPIITQKEQEKFLDLSIGIIGLSVGNAIAQNIAYSGGAKHIKLADADSLDLSNLNRVQASLTDLGSNKALLTARQILEVNPYANISIFEEYIGPDNILDFLTAEPKLDLVIDECDDLTLKNYLRLISRALRLPLLSITDVGLESKVDFHRFDQSINAAGMHEVPDFSTEEIIETYKLTEPVKLTPKQQLKLIVEIVGKKNVSQEMQHGSILRAENKLAGWPQLAMTVFAGASLATYTSLLFANNQKTYARQKSFSFPSLLKPGYNGIRAKNFRKKYAKKFAQYLRKI